MALALASKMTCLALALKMLALNPYLGNPYSYRNCISINGRHWNTCELMFTGTRKKYTGTQTCMNVNAP